MHRIPGRILLITAAFALFLVPVAAIAAGGFTDVEDDSLFIGDIQWMKNAGVTKGCNPPANDKYCPKNNVTREQMSAFMHRLAVNRVVDAGTVEGKTAAQLKGQKGDTGPAGPAGPAGSGAYFLEAIRTTRFFGEGFILEQTIKLSEPSFVIASGQAVFDTTLASTYDIFSCGITDGTNPGLAFSGSWRSPTLNSLENPYPTCATQAGLALVAGTHTIRLTVTGVQSTTFSEQANLIVTVLPLGSGTLGTLGNSEKTTVPLGHLLDE